MSLRSSIAAIPGVRTAAALARRAVRWPRNVARRAARWPRNATERFLMRFDPPEKDGVSDAPQTFEIRMDILKLEVANRVSRRRITSTDSDVVVSATTHGTRINRVHVAIESVARGSVRPARYILWLDDPALMANLPGSLKRLQRRGLEIILVPAGYRVHTKYYPYVESIDEHVGRLVTSEDDIVFPPHWLRDLVACSDRFPDEVVTFRAHRIVLAGDRIAPYDNWVPCTTTEPSYRNFGTNVSGQVYPPSFLNFVKAQGEGFRDAAPMNDDLWLHHLAVASGRRTVQVLRDPQLFPWVPGTQATGLFWTNVLGGENDLQIARTYTAEDIARIEADPA